MVVPPLIVLLSKSLTVKKFDTAAPLSPEILDEMHKQFPHIKIRQYYGMSEGSIFTSQTDKYCKPGSVGILRTGVYANVLNIDTGESVGPNTPGELVFKSRGLFKGYIGDTVSTTSCFDKDSWFHSGDIGFYDENHELFIVD